ncbi:hypothetical protein Mal48_06610 [Thalassoglobus polymorphus]|uniref:Uncharacterized protein n=1 Tax=Thalassoglobus polymorphus TaxID=2527994 RepID=A0A517QIG7_9PLAN|nr:hypothetical protein Mal48_06610 [Thalassoglobus polymorphus]
MSAPKCAQGMKHKSILRFMPQRAGFQCRQIENRLKLSVSVKVCDGDGTTSLFCDSSGNSENEKIVEENLEIDPKIRR